MGNRLSKISTRTGDGGETGLAGGVRVAKDDPRIETIGDVDELNSAVGLVRSHELPEAIEKTLAEVQQVLFNLGGELSMPGEALVDEASVDLLDDALEKLNAGLPPLKDFVMPTGTPAAAHTHLARAVCRRAERRLVALSHVAEINPAGLKLLNRLSDYLFVCARTLNAIDGPDEVLWQH